MGPYCKFCDRRCFVQRVLKDGRSMLLATCPRGMEHDREQVGQDHATAMNPATTETVTASAAAGVLGVASSGAANRTLRRWAVPVLYRRPGQGGENVYDAAAVRAAHAARPGRGARTDLRRDAAE